MSDRLKYERFLWFHRRIKSGRYPNASSLAVAFEISSRTAQRDIEFMRQSLAAPLQYDPAGRGYKYSDDAYELPASWISETNVLALALAVRLASTVPDPAIKEDLCRLIDKVIPLSGKTAGSCLETIGAKISVKNIEYSRVDQACFRQVIRALFEDRSMRITYHTPHTAITSKRSIHPLHLMHYMGSWHLLAWCSARLEIRDFAIARIRAIEFEPNRLDLPERLPSLKEYARQHFGIMQGRKTVAVALRFEPEVSPWVEEQVWHSGQQTHRDPDGSLLLRFHVADFREVIRKILSHGSGVRVESPPELRGLVQREIAAMGRVYAGAESADG